MVNVFACCLLAWAALASAEPLSVEDFFRRPDYSDPKLSPDGARIAAIVSGPKRDGLAVLDVETKKGRPVTNFADVDVVEFHWVNPQRLVFEVLDSHAPAAKVEYFAWYAVNADGSNLQEIAIPRADPTRIAAGWVPPVYVRFLGRPPQGGNDIYIELREPQYLQNTRLTDKTSVWRWDTVAGQRVEDLGGAELNGAGQWVIDRRGVLRVARTRHEGRDKIWYRPDAGTPWRVLEDAEEGQLNFRPRAFDFDNQTLYGLAYEGADKLGVYRYDFGKNRVGERVARHLDVDMGEMVFSLARRRLLGFRYDAERPGVAWVDEDMARLQQMVDRALPNTVNTLNAADANAKRALVMAYSDVAPPTYYFFDLEKRTLERFSSSRPWIRPSEMSERKFVRYKARDGLEIPAYLTLPRSGGGKNLPVVVEIHGGPWTRKQSWGFDEHAQFFASRGYAVLQPDFRGTEGYGRRHFESSFGQWGFTMQDDITDGVQWLIDQGIADKNRVCLFGGSYGGYATLWGLMQTPTLYRCGVAYVALTDISYFFDFNRRDWYRAVWADYGAKRMIGDPDRDAEKWRSVSPVAQAERLKAPVLLAYGGFDQRVPIKQGYALKSALDRYGKKYEWVEYPDEGHGWWDDKTRFDFWRRVDVFLKQHLAASAPLVQH